MSKSVRNFLLAALFILQAVTVVTIVLHNRVSSEPVLVDQMNQMMDKVADESVERTEAHLRPGFSKTSSATERVLREAPRSSVPVL
jgi:hypothetical protein